MPNISREAEITRTPASIPEGDSPYTCRIRASSPTPDGHRTKMDLETTLKNMVVDGSDGRIACWGHNKSVPYGSTSNATIDSDGNVDMDFTIERGLTIVHADAPYGKSEDLIRMIQNKHIKKSSVNIVDGWYRCNVCNVDMFKKSGGKYPCNHWPGDEEIIEKDGKKTVVEIVPDIVDGHLGELSVVWAGSNPDTEVLERSEYMLGEGLMTRKQAHNVNRHFGVNLDIQRAKPDNPDTDKGEEDVAITTEEITDIAKAVTASLVESGAIAKPEAAAAAAAPDDKSVSPEVQKQLDDMNKTIETLKKESVDSEKQDIDSEARAAYSKIRGKDLTAADLQGYEDKLSKLSLVEAKQERDFIVDYNKKLEEAEEGGERSTIDDDALESGTAEPENPMGIPDKTTDPEIV